MIHTHLLVPEHAILPYVAIGCDVYDIPIGFPGLYSVIYSLYTVLHIQIIGIRGIVNVRLSLLGTQDTYILREKCHWYLKYSYKQYKLMLLGCDF